MPDTDPVQLPSDIDPAPRSPEAHHCFDLGEALADAAIADQDLVRYIQNWNNGDANTSLITSLEALRMAVYIDRLACEPYDNALDVAEQQGLGLAYVQALGDRLDLTIFSSSFAALVRQGSEWASKLVEGGPAAHGLEHRFRTDDALLNWAVTEVRRPPICGPDGRAIITDETETAFLTMALRAALSGPIRLQWIMQ